MQCLRHRVYRLSAANRSYLQLKFSATTTITNKRQTPDVTAEAWLGECVEGGAYGGLDPVQFRIAQAFEALAFRETTQYFAILAVPSAKNKENAKPRFKRT
jgi:hypothetical protein